MAKKSSGDFVYPRDAAKIEKHNARLWLLAGNEPFMMEEFLQGYRKRQSGLTPRTWWGDMLKTPGDVAELGGGGDLFAEDFLSIIREPEKVTTKLRKSLAARVTESLDESGSHYVFIPSDARKVPAAIQNLPGIVTVTCWRLFSDALRGFIEKRAEARGFKIRQGAVKLLLTMLGHDLAAIARELDKLFLFLADEKTIEEVHVQATVVPSTEGIDNIASEIVLAMFEKRSTDALILWRRALQTGIEPMQVSASLFYSLRRLLEARAVLERISSGSLEKSLADYARLRHRDDFRSNMDKKRIREEVARAVDQFDGSSFGRDAGISLFRDSRSMLDALAHAVHYSEAVLVDAAIHSFEQDLRIKRGEVDSTTAVEEMIHRFGGIQGERG